MELVLLPHHNTVSSLQNLQAALHKETANTFLAAYPLVCVLGYMDTTGASNEKLLHRQMQLLNDKIKETDGTITFTDIQEQTSESSDIRLLVSIPFMDAIKAAGFTPEEKPFIILGHYPMGHRLSQTAARTDILHQQELPSASRSFRIALMETKTLSTCTPLSEAEPAAAFSWKFHLPFWVKLR